MTKNLTIISTGGAFLLILLPESIGNSKYNSVISITLKTHWKENSSYIPLPFGNLPKIVMALFNEGSTKIV